MILHFNLKGVRFRMDMLALGVHRKSRGGEGHWDGTTIVLEVQKLHRTIRWSQGRIKIKNNKKLESTATVRNNKKDYSNNLNSRLRNFSDIKEIGKLKTEEIL